MKRILLTGATGFVGSYVARLLVNQGYQVIAIKRSASKLHLILDIKDSITWVDCDLDDLSVLDEIMADIDGVIHCAAKVSLAGKKGMHRLYQINITATKDLVNLALEHSVKKFVYISSIAALGLHTNNLNLDENTEWNDTNKNGYYAISKQYGEREVWRGQAEGLETVILNPSLILGAGFWNRGSCNIFKELNLRNKVYPKGSIGMVDVRDVAKLSVLALKSNINGERYIVSTANKTYKYLSEQVAKYYKQAVPKYALNAVFHYPIVALAKLLAIMKGAKSLVNLETLESTARKSSYNNTKVKKDFNYSFIDIDKTIEETTAAYLSSKKQGKNYNILTFDT